jgi:archaellum component FlaC
MKFKGNTLQRLINNPEETQERIEYLEQHKKDKESLFVKLSRKLSPFNSLGVQLSQICNRIARGTELDNFFRK